MDDTPEVILFGPSSWDEPWHQYDATIPKEVNDTALNFIHDTIGLEGEHHPCHGWIIDMNHWAALRKYIQWCKDESLDFNFHASQVASMDPGHTSMATKMMKKVPSRCQGLEVATDSA